MTSIPVSSYEEILESRQQYISLMKNLGVNVRSQNRVILAFKVIEELVKVMDDSSKLEQFLATTGRKGLVDYALQEMMELRFIIENLDISIQDEKVMQQKFLEFSKGPVNPLDENLSSGSNNPRNIAYELFVASDFLSVGIEAILFDPNPDMMVSINGREYQVQCKRVFSENAIESNFKKASRQIRKNLKENQHGLVFMSINPLISRKGNFLQSSNHMSGYDYVSRKLMQFVENNKKIWQDPQKLPKKRLPAVIFDYQVTMYTLDADPPQSVLTQRMPTNTIWPINNEFEEFKFNFQALINKGVFSSQQSE